MAYVSCVEAKLVDLEIAIKEWEGVDRLFYGWMLSRDSVKIWICVLYPLCLCIEPIKLVESGGILEICWLISRPVSLGLVKGNASNKTAYKAELYILQIALCLLLSKKIPCSNYVYKDKDQCVIFPSHCKENIRKYSFPRNYSIKLMWGNGWRENSSNSV